MEYVLNLSNLELCWGRCIGWKWDKSSKAYLPYERVLCGIRTSPPDGIHRERWEAIVMEYVESQQPTLDAEFKYEGA